MNQKTKERLNKSFMMTEATWKLFRIPEELPVVSQIKLFEIRIILIK